jgi:hypothetical protein
MFLGSACFAALSGKEISRETRKMETGKRSESREKRPKLGRKGVFKGLNPLQWKRG